MQVLHERCAGLDVHKRTIAACAVTPEGRRVRTFSTMTRGILEMGDWLREQGVSHVAMESTGVYWKPVFNLLEEEFECIVANAHHIKNVPGRKTDVKDAEWIAQLLQHGLIRPSFIPGRPERELRELVRYRRSLIRGSAQVVNRIQKVLEGANIKLASVASDVTGASGTAMLKAMVQGEEDPERLADMARGRLRDKHDELVKAMQGKMGPHQRMMLASQLRHLQFLDAEITGLDQEIEERMRPFEEVIQRLDGIPGMGVRSAQEIVAEIGIDMSRFPTSRHISSWARVAPGNYQSAGRSKSGRTGPAGQWLRSTLVGVAWSASHTKDTYLAAQHRRISARRGSKRAALAVAHSILVIVYTMLSRGITYHDLGHDYFEQRDRRFVLQSSVRRIERLGYKVSLEAA